MRDAVGSTWIFSLVITFTLIFSGFLVLALSYSKAYKLKNEMTSIIEKYEGITTKDSLNNLGSLNIINQYLQNNNYQAKGNCSIGEYGVDNLDANPVIITDANSNQKYYYCIGIDKHNNHNSSCSAIFKLTVFYDFNLPVLGRLRKYSISGKTNEIVKPYFLDNQITC